ncbi:MAG TPA: ATP-dependent helicase, partial [Leptospiraceae bacterium]|nr:ATP-dependent helicase [Leptospiraceae bacterium]
FVFLAHFDFDLKRTEIFYYEFDRNSGRTLSIEKIPEGAVSAPNAPVSSGRFPVEAALEYALIKTSEILKIDSEKRKDEIHKETVSLFRKEEYKLEKSEEKAIRQLEEKLDRQEAVSKWNPSADRGHVISRTKNEILKTRENFEKELRKIRSGSNIRISLELFQVYCGTD